MQSRGCENGQLFSGGAQLGCVKPDLRHSAKRQNCFRVSGDNGRTELSTNMYICDSGTFYVHDFHEQGFGY